MILRRAVRRLMPLVLAAFLSGCATAGDPRDPFEAFNRDMFAFNQALDHDLIKPAAENYRAVVPEPAQRGIRNFFNNLNDVIVFVNQVLQLKWRGAIDTLGRVTFNTTAGVLGFFDLATEHGVVKADEDFGQTLGYWGVPAGPYIVLPLFGPSSGRDTVGLVGDLYTSPLFWSDETALNWSLATVRVIQIRADLLDAESVLEKAAVDRYVFVRDAFLQRRLYLIHDGNPPRTLEDFEDPEPEPRRSGAPAPYATPGPMPPEAPAASPPLASHLAERVSAGQVR
jgi:phospholipid-binding lipoprotein MlaA